MNFRADAIAKRTTTHASLDQQREELPTIKVAHGEGLLREQRCAQAKGLHEEITHVVL